MAFSRVAVSGLILVSALAVVTPSAGASGPPRQCLQVFPWSILCQTGLDRIVCELQVCPGGSFPPIECAQVLPLSELCGGDVRGFVCYKVDCEGIPDPEPVACVPDVGSQPELCVDP